MTCASCASRIEKKLNRLDGASAQVNYATEMARVEVADDVSADDIIATVEATGYHATPPPPSVQRQPSARPTRPKVTIPRSSPCANDCSSPPP